MVFHDRPVLETALLILTVTALAGTARGGEQVPGAPTPTREKPIRKAFKLPGVVVDFQKRCVDIEAVVCLDDGMLELIACTEGTKEHESIVTIKARPMHVHTALLLLGLNNGNPAMRKVVDEEDTRWIDIPPRGDPVDVYLVFQDDSGKVVEHPISDFVTRTERHSSLPTGAEEGNTRRNNDRFPKTFLFAGSILVAKGSGPRTYVADQSGSVISIATFGDELLCLPGVHAKGNHALMWRIKATKLPDVGTKVTLRLRPYKKAKAKADPSGTHVPAQEKENTKAAGKQIPSTL